MSGLCNVDPESDFVFLRCCKCGEYKITERNLYSKITPDKLTLCKNVQLVCDLCGSVQQTRTIPYIGYPDLTPEPPQDDNDIEEVLRCIIFD